jgi:hypothetical protein
VGLRDKISRLKRAAEGEVAVWVCEECGEELRVREGIELDLVAESWAEGQRSRGREVHSETPEDVRLINNHPCEWTALRNKRTGERLFSSWGRHGA